NINGYEYNRDIYELVRVFFPHKDIKNIEYINQNIDGYLLHISIFKQNNTLNCSSKLFVDNNLVVENTENLDAVYIHRSKEKSTLIGIKKSIYNTLIKITDKKLPWGILTGI